MPKDIAEDLKAHLLRPDSGQASIRRFATVSPSTMLRAGFGKLRTWLRMLSRAHVLVVLVMRIPPSP